MLYTFPDYYKEFQCTADRCEDTCCAGWAIVIDDGTLKRYRRTGGSLGARLRREIRWKEKVFGRREERCAFLDEENLCDIYKELGQKGLCRTCRLYPRHIEEFENVREVSLSVSCPEVAGILLRHREPVSFLEFHREGQESWPEFDELTYSVLADGRDVMIRILQDRSLPIRTRAGLVLGLAHDMEGRLRRGETFSCQELYRRYETKEAADYTAARLADYERKKEKQFRDFGRELHSLYQLELLREDWEMLLRESEFFLCREGAKGYHEIRERFRKWREEHLPDWEIALEQILVYFIATYFCGAVYDGRVWGKARMAAVSAFLIAELWKARWLKNEEALDISDMTEILYRYSRELEHSDLNLERMERIMERRGIPWMERKKEV